jgi:TNF receptor-associated protein 1
MRRLMKAMNQESGPTKYDLEINPRHEVIKRLHAIKGTDEDLAKAVTAQLFDNARMAAGVVDDPRELVTRLNSLLETVLAEKK